jgi:hypothetical protein
MSDNEPDEIINSTHNTFSKKAGHFNDSSQLFSEIYLPNVGCILNYIRLIITREISCIYIQLLLQLCTEVSQVTTQRTMKI